MKKHLKIRNFHQIFFIKIIYFALFILSIENFALSFEKEATFLTKAKQAILIDYDTGEILFSKQDTERMTPSSMSKIMTSYLVFSALKNGSLKIDDKFHVSEKAWRTQGSKMFLSLSSNVTVENLILGMIVQSGNDACVTLAEGMFGNEEIFADHMNKKALELGLTNSHFNNATGLPHDDHYTTARDLAILAVRIIRDFNEYYWYHSEKDFEYNKITQANRNTLLGIGGVDGIKTGHTESGGYGIVISAERNGRRLICVINGLSSIKERREEAEKILNYGFNNFIYKTLYKKGETIETISIAYGDKLKIPLTINEDIILYRPKHFAKDLGMEVQLQYNDNMLAPIDKGTEVGFITIRRNNIYGSDMKIPLVTSEKVEKANFIQVILQNISMLLNE